MRGLVKVSALRALSMILLAAACAWGTNGYAASDEDAVKAAVEAYHGALSTFAPAKIEALWAHDDTVMDIEPRTKTIATGWDGVKKTIEGYFPVFTELKITQTDGPHVFVKGEIARSMCIATAVFKMKDGTSGSNGIFETDVFEKRDGAWLLVSHSAAQVPQ